MMTSDILNTFPYFNKSAADDFENIPETDWKLPFSDSTIIEKS